MPSEAGIMDALDLLAASGLVPRSQTRDAIASAWLATMPEVTDDMLLGAVVLYLRGEDCAWFPKPGQLLAHIRGTEDTAHADWALLRSLRTKHGAQQPMDPSEPRTFPLDYHSRPEEQARWKGVVNCGGWEVFRGKSLDHDSRRALFREGYESAVDSAKRQLAGPNNWSELVRMEVKGWLDRRDPWLAFQAVFDMARKPDFATQTPRNPMERIGFRLHPNPRREHAMFAGLLAAGGWREIWPDSTTIPDAMKIADASNRKAFCAAYRAAIQRGTRQNDASAVLRLADSGPVKNMLGLADWGKP